MLATSFTPIRPRTTLVRLIIAILNWIAQNPDIVLDLLKLVWGPSN